MEATTTAVSKEELERLLDVEKLKYCFECGICTSSCSMAELLGKDYNPRVLLEKFLLDPENVLNSCEPWLCAWCYRCYKRCPQALNLPEIFLFIRKTALEHVQKSTIENAFRKIVEKVPLPLVTTSICFHPERAGLDRQEILAFVEALYKERLKREKRRKVATNNRSKIAVIGSGPAGLAAAYELTLKGYKITVFETLKEAGGMLGKCIPEDRLSKQVLAKEIDFLKALGVEIKTGISVGGDLSFADLQTQGYSAIFVATGAHKSQRLKIEGVNLEGAIYALDFLWQVNCGESVEIGRNVVVIGGGNVAVDAAKTALQRKAEKVTILYRRSKGEMPANPWEAREAEEKGVEIEFLVSPKKILGEKGKVSGVELVRMELGEPDESGRKKPVPIEGSEFTVEADMVILAIGESPDLEFLPREVELNEDGTVWVNPITMETTLRGVFAGGDAVSGPASVIEAVRAGKCAAESIDAYLKSSGE